MHNLKSIREHLGVTQQALADGLGCTQGNIGHYEKGQEFPPKSARALIQFAAQRGLSIGFDHVYGEVPLPELLPLPLQDATPATEQQGA